MELQILHAGISHPSPYFYNFGIALKEIAPEIEISLDSVIPSFSPRDQGILHFHRLKRFYHSDSKESAENFLSKIKNAKRNGWKIIWTIHNFFPIDRKISYIDFYTTNELSKLSDVLFTHTELMKKNAEKLFSRKVINHSYSINGLEGIFDNNIINLSRQEHEIVFALAGNITPYKCAPECIESFKRLKEKFSNRELRLIIAGPLSKEIDIKKHIGEDKDILIYNSFIGNNGWRELNKNVDIFLGTYDLSNPAFRYGFFPSSVPQILSYKKVMILPDCPEIREFVPNQERAIFYNHQDRESLFKAMEYGTDLLRRNSIEKNLEGIVYGVPWTEVTRSIVQGIESITSK